MATTDNFANLQPRPVWSHFATLCADNSIGVALAPGCVNPPPCADGRLLYGYPEDTLGKMTPWGKLVRCPVSGKIRRFALEGGAGSLPPKAETNSTEESFMVHHQEHPTHHALHLETLGKSSGVTGPVNESWQVKLTDPATYVMTDFRERAFFQVAPDEQIDEVLNKMKHAGLRAAFVMDKQSDKLLGMITSYDIMGEKPLRYLQNAGFTEHKDILVSDIMESLRELVAVEMHDVEKATAQSVLEVLQKTGRTHLPVVERKEGEKLHLRGLFSASKVFRLTEDSRRKATKIR